MDKKEAKKQYLKTRLEDPAVSEWEKNQIRQRLGINETISENDFRSKPIDELLYYVYNYLENQLSAIRRKKRTNTPFEYLPENIKTIYYLSTYSSDFESDSLEQMYEYEESVDDMRKLAQAFKQIERQEEATLIETILKKGKITDNDVELLQEHFWEYNVAEEIEKAIEKYIYQNMSSLLQLQTI